MREGRHIVVGITGSIAAYKAALLVRELVRTGAEVHVVMTEAATRFIPPLTLSTLSRNDVVVDMFPPETSASTWHITLGMWADAMIIAPASANTIARLAHGFADNALTSLVLALRCPLIVAPAMDTDMYLHAATRENLGILARRGVTLVDPDAGELASGLTGPGRLPDTAVLMEELERVLHPAAGTLDGVRVLVTAGPTQEAIDPVRFIGNHSSGRMGFAIAREAALRGADVTLISGPTACATPLHVRRVDVTTADGMHRAVNAHHGDADILIMSAAVADFRPTAPADRKIKKADQEAERTLVLEPTVDILADVASRKGGRIHVGFALETGGGLDHARRKLAAKDLDLVVLNDALVDGAGFGGETNIVTLVHRNMEPEALPLMTKSDVAGHLLDRITTLLHNRRA